MNQGSSKRSYAILGTGAIGGYYGACLQKGGFEVHFLLRSDYEYVRQHGLTIKSADGDFALPHVKAYKTVTDMPPCDVVVVALKTTQNEHLANLLPPIVKHDGVVLLLQNGLGSEAVAAQVVGPERVMGGLCFICSNKLGPGRILHLDYKAIAIGDYAPNYEPAGISDRLEAIAQDFELAGIPILRAEDLLLARWKKLMWNIPFNGLSVVLNATTADMMASEPIRMLAVDLMEEIRAIAAAYGRSIPPDYTQKMIDDTQAMQPYRTSMKIDFDEKRPLEIDAIVGKPLQAARDANVEAPRLAMLYQQLLFLDTHNRR